MRRVVRSKQAGFSLVEGIIALTLVSVLLVNATVLINATQRTSSEQAEEIELQRLADQTLDRMVLALLEADRDVTIPQNAAPFHSDRITYQRSTGVEDGEIVYSEPARIWRDANDSKVIWTENPDDPLEAKSVVWGKHVRSFLLDELGANMADDNGNGLVDEFGLSFDIESQSVLVRITLEKTTESGQLLSAAAETRATFRN